MIEISLCMIVKNEEEVLADCLKSVENVVDEIIVMDTGSTDQTKEIASKFTQHVYEFDWVEHFAKARNAAFAKATKPYILWLDADDVLTTEDQEKFLRLKASLDPSVDAVSMHYHTAFDDSGKPSFTYRRNRLIKRERGFQWIGAVHEYLAVGGNIFASDIAVTHQKSKKTTVPSSDRNLKIYESMLERKEEMTARDVYYFANELREHGQHRRSIQYYEQFLTSKAGWVEDNIAACLSISDNYNALDEKDNAQRAIVRSFLYDMPRPQHSCRMGDFFFEKEQYKAAIFWFSHALSFEEVELPGFNLKAFSTWYPALQLVVCHWRLNQMEEARRYHEITKKHHPTHPSVLYNEPYFLT
ncbi:tetratricopeptide repeat-containing glycosyltransferase family 2 protein [Aureibacillus halotolerans]|uniref:Glycosyl transferase family 2 n=1 Tax=Aureibacillus halotolerans TaxID=1508390 RepID=A0A4R6TVZ0_9BACI|nr:glycosyltransferase family 2 protein [Aureibacillus halotolerans]TDQ35436.1 glycosyl transferase family 2 [Aureibacillus halotolerans]